VNVLLNTRDAGIIDGGRREYCEEGLCWCDVIHWTGHSIPCDWFVSAEKTEFTGTAAWQLGLVCSFEAKDNVKVCLRPLLSDGRKIFF
jgi:hypothetical protein